MRESSMNKLISLAILAGGIVLVTYDEKRRTPKK